MTASRVMGDGGRLRRLRVRVKRQDGLEGCPASATEGRSQSEARDSTPARPARWRIRYIVMSIRCGCGPRADARRSFRRSVR